MTPPREPAWAASLRRSYRAGLALLGVQLVLLGAWSALEASRFALSWDFSIFGQAWYLIAHGDLDPYSTLLGHAFWRDHSAFLLWPSALLWYVWPRPETLLWLQDLAIVGSEAVALRWTCELLDRRGSPGRAPLAAMVVVLLLADPWIFWTAAFDFHVEPFGALFTLLAARDHFAGRRRSWLWVGLALASSNVAASYLLGLGLSSLLARGRRSRPAGVLLALAAAWLAALSLVHGDLGDGYGSYSYLTGGTPGLASVAGGLFRRPGRVLHQLWLGRWDLWGSVAVGGVPGLLSPVTSLVALVAVGEGALSRVFVSVPGFQYLPAYLFLPVGTALVLARLLSFGRLGARLAALALAAVSLVLSLGYSVVFLPRAPSQWLRVSPGAARVLAQASRRIPEDAEVVVSQGVAGPFSGRRLLFTLLGPGPIPLRARTVWLVVAPRQGVETEQVSSADGLVAEMAARRGASLVLSGSGVWVFRWRPSPRERSLFVPGPVSSTPAWVVPGPAGVSETAGPEGTWRVASNGREGYVLAYDYWRETRPGEYSGTVRLSSTGPVNVELWDSTTSSLLARTSAPATDGAVVDVSVHGDLRRAVGERAFDGIGPWRAELTPPPPGDELELRVWTPGGEDVSVYRCSLHRSDRPVAGGK